MDPGKHGVVVHPAGGSGPYLPGRRAAVHEGPVLRRGVPPAADTFERRALGLRSLSAVLSAGPGTKAFRPLPGSQAGCALGPTGKTLPKGAQGAQGNGLRGICEAQRPLHAAATKSSPGRQENWNPDASGSKPLVQVVESVEAVKPTAGRGRNRDFAPSGPGVERPRFGSLD
jgi:hypothetical protein